MSGPSAGIPASPRPEPELTLIAAGQRTPWLFFEDLRRFRDLALEFVSRDLTVLYKQSILGPIWVILTPLFSTALFSLVFGRWVGMGSDDIPYPLFTFLGVAAWTYFSQTVMGASTSLILGSRIFTKVYFPRVLLPLTPAVSKLVDFGVGMSVATLMALIYGFRPGPGILFLPVLVVLMFATASGIGAGLAALAVQYRDVRFATPVVMQMLLYGAPVIWPVSKVPSDLRLYYGFYPMAGIIEGFRAALLNRPLPWDLLLGASVVAFLSVAIGAGYFRRTERILADVI